MILEAAIGDAYGAGFEFQELDYIIKNNDLTKYHKHGMYTEIYKRYTDDTQMAIAITELLLEEENWNEIKVADKFVEVFHRDKRRGYSDRVYNALDASTNGAAFLKNINNGSNGNGSAMRAYSIGLIKDVNQLLEFCEIQAKTSHNTAEGISCAKRIALAVHFYKYKLGDQTSLIEFINETLKEKEIYKVTSPIDMHGYFTTQAVIKIVSEANSMQDCLKIGIDYGGDTDTVAALCMAILSQKESCEKILPQFLYDDLENGTYGKDFLIGLDHKLAAKFQ
ncbi:ADP-ribosylglycohydrolase family protein [Flavobacterium sp. MC2016-06]|jgi:ADP-ribosyl-[dinitrogen reductase] hydrolase|uniref:ADP-ribosylglycohydrolase family protein n=1 Tax=Flavobacterium sp. MC2016-06 TaxID=2676308 RepID=UPI0012BA8FC5|nr:ADP-ribosylglycohydrolase family protein [Flavobacterium sp. MC2016-06]MBU3860050.1 ADP-ribosylglycohydrolase family protein [Flavobacterium sp. MC2016-06]